MKLASHKPKNLVQKVDRLVLSLVINGVLLLLLAILTVWSPLVLRLLVGLVIIVMAYLFFLLAYRIWEFKKHLEKFLKMK